VQAAETADGVQQTEPEPQAAGSMKAGKERQRKELAPATAAARWTRGEEGAKWCE
jgi:hypothetical protein